ncbi:helix-turn-helix domain-containing protein [Sphaerisporangium sp. TRM90804]|uniref:winged helix-turn-helix transcriptional regulator n=1 Tax=Sphaerisporangium sp. TRM90804 TaxID=3031113 RepID=UPI002448F887|nr:helix-turn-helix domain-containing protein [Sphaerisporangium sp. TRM90804]MDH2424046.1 helix-turn-helix domain-containing protein [Sphaerisporangium sp. TRM90804]
MAEPLDPRMFDPVCPSSAMPIQIGDKWTAMIVLCLEGGRRRFNEIRVPLRGITPKVLTQTLRAMERDGLVTRTAYDENPPRVEYELTELGRSLLTLIAAARAWSEHHLPALLEAREAHGPASASSRWSRGTESGSPQGRGPSFR